MSQTSADQWRDTWPISRLLANFRGWTILRKDEVGNLMFHFKWVTSEKEYKEKELEKLNPETQSINLLPSLSLLSSPPSLKSLLKSLLLNHHSLPINLPEYFIIQSRQDWGVLTDGEAGLVSTVIEGFDAKRGEEMGDYEEEEGIREETEGFERLYLAKDSNKDKNSTYLISDLQKYALSKSKAHGNYEKPIVIEEFLQEPWLVDGFRADIRSILIIYSLDPLKVIFNKGYIKRASVLHEPKKKPHKMAYSTNFESHRLHSDFDKIKKELSQPLSKKSEELAEDFWARVTQSLKALLESWGSQLKTPTKGRFMVLAVDFTPCNNCSQIFVSKITPWTQVSNDDNNLVHELFKETVQLTVDLVLEPENEESFLQDKPSFSRLV